MTIPRGRVVLFTWSILTLVGLSACRGGNAGAGSEAPSIYPSQAEVDPAQTVRFDLTNPSGSAAGPTVWSVAESGGGAVDASGRYTAPDVEGTFHVVASSTDLASSRQVATVRVVKKGVRVDVSPQTADVTTGATLALTAKVTGTSNGAVTWSVEEAGGGTVSNGVYSAPATPGVYHVVATSVVDPARSDYASVNVLAAPAPPPPPAPEVSVTLTPVSASTQTGATVQFTAAVSGTTNLAVAWSVVEGSAGGSVSTAGLYTAPATAGNYHVKATSQADASKSSVATVAVAAPVTAPPPPPPTTAKTLQVQGRRLLDACGSPLVVRGPEQLLGYGMEGPGDAAGHFNALIDQIASTGANALRILPNSSPGQPFAGWTSDAISRLDEVLARACTTHHLVVYLSYIDENESGTNANARANFWSKQAVKDLVAKYSTCLVVDGLQEVAYWNVSQWRTDALAAVDWFRSQGYTQPLDILSNGYGRDLPAIIDYGADVVARDPLGRVILGWQAYWGQSYNTGDWAGTHGLSSPTSPADGIRRASELPFPVQAGLLNVAEPEMEAVDYQSAMTAAQTYGIGWFWWWGSFNGFVDNNILTNTQYWDASHLRAPYGPIVVWTHPASIHNSAVKACVP